MDHETKQEYYENGNIFKETTYLNGIKDGPEKIWNPDGVLKQEAVYKNGLAHGRAVFYYPTGAIQREIYYLEGTLCSFVDYDTNGNQINTLTHHHTDV